MSTHHGSMVTVKAEILQTGRDGTSYWAVGRFTYPNGFAEHIRVTASLSALPEGSRIEFEVSGGTIVPKVLRD